MFLQKFFELEGQSTSTECWDQEGFWFLGNISLSNYLSVGLFGKELVPSIRQ
jgi:hypothetical protein